MKMAAQDIEILGIEAGRDCVLFHGKECTRQKVFYYKNICDDPHNNVLLNDRCSDPDSRVNSWLSTQNNQFIKF